MQSSSLGQTALMVSRIGLGLAALGRPGYINLGHAADLGGETEMAVMEARAHAVLDAAWNAGVRYFDAARSYGRAEMFLARWLNSRQTAADAVTVGSKWGYTYTADWKVQAERHEIKDHSLATLVRQAAETRDILGSQLDLYQIHSATLDSGVLDNREVLEELARLQRNGLKIGLSLTGPRQSETLKRALEISVHGERLFDCVQATWNLLEPSTGSALQSAHAAGMGVIIKEGLANGRLTQRNDNPSFAPKRKLLLGLAARFETSLDALALAAVLARPWVDCVLSGAATVDQLQSNLASLAVVWDDGAEEECRSLAESPDEYWKTRARLSWN